jgi:hypothetical protein
MKTIGKSDHARRAPARKAGGIRLSFPTHPEVAMRTLAGIRPMRMPAGCHSQHWHGASIRMRAGD